LGRFSLFVHDEMTAELLKLNTGDSEKLDLVQQISVPGYEVLNAKKSPRFIKTHFPISLLPPNLLDVGCKVSLQISFGDRTFDSNNLWPSSVKKETYNEFNNFPTRCDLFSLLHFCSQLYMFQVLTPIIRSSYNYKYSFWYRLTESTTIHSRC